MNGKTRGIISTLSRSLSWSLSLFLFIDNASLEAFSLCNKSSSGTKLEGIEPTSPILDKSPCLFFRPPFLSNTFLSSAINQYKFSRIVTIDPPDIHTYNRWSFYKEYNIEARWRIDLFIFVRHSYENDIFL